MMKDIYFDNFFGPGWPSLDQLEPYFIAPSGKEWFYTGGNDSGGLDVQVGRPNSWLSLAVQNIIF